MLPRDLHATEAGYRVTVTCLRVCGADSGDDDAAVGHWSLLRTMTELHPPRPDELERAHLTSCVSAPEVQ